MSSRTLKDIVRAQINHDETDFVPYSLLLEKSAVEKLDQYYESTCWKEDNVESVYITREGFDTWDTFICYDPSHPEKKRDAFGSEWTYTDNIIHLDKPGLEGIKYENYKWPTIDDFLNQEKWERFKQECRENSGKYLVGRNGAGPFELSWRMMGVENALEACVADEDLYEDIVEHITVLMEQFIDECVKLPVDAILFGDDWCDQRGCTMGPDRWRRFFKPRLARMYDRIHKAGRKAITHVCGSVAVLVPELIEIGLDVLESVQPEAAEMNPYELKRRFGKDMTFWGCLGCQNIVTFGTPEELKSEIRRLRMEMSRGGGYILAPAKPLNHTVQTENLVAIYETFIEENYKI